VTIYPRVRRGHRHANLDWVWLRRGPFSNTAPRKILEPHTAEARYYLTDQKIRRGVHKSVQSPEADIRDWIEHWNQGPRPFA
jgi:hypothetical protein